MSAPDGPPPGLPPGGVPPMPSPPPPPAPPPPGPRGPARSAPAGAPPGMPPGGMPPMPPVPDIPADGPVKVGVFVPSGVPDVDPRVLRDWARLIDAGPWSSLAATDRAAYANPDPPLPLPHARRAPPAGAPRGAAPAPAAGGPGPPLAVPGRVASATLGPLMTLAMLAPLTERVTLST